MARCLDKENIQLVNWRAEQKAGVMEALYSLYSCMCWKKGYPHAHQIQAMSNCCHDLNRGGKRKKPDRCLILAIMWHAACHQATNDWEVTGSRGFSRSPGVYWEGVLKGWLIRQLTSTENGTHQAACGSLLYARQPCHTSQKTSHYHHVGGTRHWIRMG